MTSPSNTSAPACTIPLSQALPLVIRLTLGGLLIFSGWMKLGISSFGGILPTLDPQQFLFAIKGFELPLVNENPPLGAFLAFFIPWLELTAGFAVLLGIWARAGALLIAGLMLAFTLGILGVIMSGRDVNCPCFGAIKFLCSGTISWCHVIRNTGFFLAAAYMFWKGPGPLTLSGIVRRPI